MIKRNHYLNQLQSLKDKPFIKVLTGMRRVGKSTLFDLFIEQLKKEKIADDHILLINFELPTSFLLNDYALLTDFVLTWAKGKKGTLYLFLDEIGRVKDWEKAVNGFHAMKKFDLYITGSNADLLSSDLSSYLGGRYIEILVHPLSFPEFLIMHPKARFQDYLTFGGIPSIAAFNLDYSLSMNALRDSFRSALFEDVITRHQIRNPIVLERLIQYVLTNTAKTFSALSISNYFKSQRISVSVDTLLLYLDMLENAYLIYRAKRYDIIGKQILKLEEKYFIADLGFREALVGQNQQGIEMMLENLTYIELLRSGYRVEIGKLGVKEIDFIATKDQQRIYIQISYLLSSENTIQREFESLKSINDNFPKYVISMDQFNLSKDGIIHLNFETFLLQGLKQ